MHTRIILRPSFMALLLVCILCSALAASPAQGQDVAGEPAPKAGDEAAYLAAQAGVHLRFGHPDRAIPLLNQAIALAPDSPELTQWRMSLASACIQAGQETKGIDILRELKASENSVAASLAGMSMGRHYESKGLTDKAIEAYEDVALHADGKFQRAAASRHIARILRDARDAGPYLERYEALLAENPQDLNALRLAAAVYAAIGKEPVATLDLFRKLLKNNPHNGEVWVEYLCAVEAAGQIDEAVAQYQVLMERLPNYHQFCCENLARLLQGQGKTEAAREWVEKSAQGAERTPVVSARLGRLYLSLDMPQDSVAPLQEAVEGAGTEGMRASAAIDMAKALMDLERYPEAMDLLTELENAEWLSIRDRANALLSVCREKQKQHGGTNPNVPGT